VLTDSVLFLFQHKTRWTISTKKRIYTESNNAVVFPFDFHIAVQRPLQALWSRLLCDHKLPAALFAPCFKSLLISLLPASKAFISVLLLCISVRPVLFGLGYPAGNNTTSLLGLPQPAYPSNTTWWRSLQRGYFVEPLNIFRRLILLFKLCPLGAAYS
jgi:hypothetical protein